MQELSQKNAGAASPVGWKRWLIAVIGGVVAGGMVYWRLSASMVWWNELAAPGRVWAVAVGEGGWGLIRELWRFQRDFPGAMVVGHLAGEPLWFPVSTALAVGLMVFWWIHLRRLQAPVALVMGIAGAVLLPVTWLVTVVPLLFVAELFRKREREVLARGCELTALIALPLTTPTLPAAAVAAIIFLTLRFPPIGLVLGAFAAGWIRVLQGDGLGQWPTAMVVVSAVVGGAFFGWSLAGRRLHEQVMHGAGGGVLCAIFPPVLPLGMLLQRRLPPLPRVGVVAGVVLVMLFGAVGLRAMPGWQERELVRAMLIDLRGLAGSLAAAEGETLWAGRAELGVLGFAPEVARRMAGWPELMPVLLANERMLRQPEAFVTAQPAFDQAVFTGSLAEVSALPKFLGQQGGWGIGEVNAAGVWLARSGGVGDPAPFALDLADGIHPVLVARRAGWLQVVGRGGEARRWLDAAAAGDPVPMEVHLRRARYYLELQRKGESLEAVERVLAVEPNQPAALSMKAQILFGAKEYGAAYDASARLVALTPNDLSALWLHARIAHQVQNFRGEARALERLIAIKESAGVPATMERVLLGQAYARDGDARQALRQLERVREAGDLTPALREQVEEIERLVRERSGRAQ